MVRLLPFLILLGPAKGLTGPSPAPPSFESATREVDYEVDCNECGELTDETVSSPAGARSAPRSVADDLIIEPYGTLRRNTEIPGQAHHLNQDAAFREVIPHADGMSVKLQGNAFPEIGSPHFNPHANLEAFWNQFRRGGARYGEVPTNLEYSRGLADSLRAADLTPVQVQQALRASIRQRIGAGQLGGLQIPRVPRRMPQARP